jgi:hypothetical protein
MIQSDIARLSKTRRQEDKKTRRQEDNDGNMKRAKAQQPIKPLEIVFIRDSESLDLCIPASPDWIQLFQKRNACKWRKGQARKLEVSHSLRDKTLSPGRTPAD